MHIFTKPFPFYREFMEGYVELLRRRFGTKRVNANQVYQEYINDRDHIHMNSTQWETLTIFVKWLGKEGGYSSAHCEHLNVGINQHFT